MGIHPLPGISIRYKSMLLAHEAQERKGVFTGQLMHQVASSGHQMSLRIANVKQLIHHVHTLSTKKHSAWKDIPVLSVFLMYQQWNFASK